MTPVSPPGSRLGRAGLRGCRRSRERQRRWQNLPHCQIGLAIAQCGTALHTPDLIHPLNRLRSESQLYGGRNWVTERSGNWLKSRSLKVAGPGVKPRGMYLQNLSLDIKSQKKTEASRTDGTSGAVLASRTDGTSGAFLACPGAALPLVADSPQCRTDEGLAGRRTRCLWVSVSRACTHARVRAHIQYLVLQREDHNISTFSPATRGPYPASPFPLVRLHQRCQPQGAFRLLPCVSFSLSEPGSPCPHPWFSNSAAHSSLPGSFQKS